MKKFFQKILAAFRVNVWAYIVFLLSAWLLFQMVHSRLAGVVVPRDRMIALILAQVYLLYILVSRAKRDGGMAFGFQAVLLVSCAGIYWFGSGGQVLQERLLAYEAYCLAPEPEQVSAGEGVFIFDASTHQVLRPGNVSGWSVRQKDDAVLVACVSQDKVLLETCWYGDKRFQVESTISLIDRATADVLAVETVSGKEPAQCRSTITSRNYVASEIIGNAPTASAIGEVLLGWDVDVFPDS